MSTKTDASFFMFSAAAFQRQLFKIIIYFSLKNDKCIKEKKIVKVLNSFGWEKFLSEQCEFAAKH